VQMAQNQNIDLDHISLSEGLSSIHDDDANRTPDIDEEEVSLQKRLMQMKNRKGAYSKLIVQDEDDFFEEVLEKDDEDECESVLIESKNNSALSDVGSSTGAGNDYAVDDRDPSKETPAVTIEDGSGGGTNPEDSAQNTNSTEELELGIISPLDVDLDGVVDIQSVSRRKCFEKVGKCTILCSPLYHATGVGVVGPNWFGPITTISLIWGLTIFFFHKAGTETEKSQVEGEMNLKQYLCAFFAILSAITLFCVACVDPGVVTESNQNEYYPLEVDNDCTQRRRYCDICSVYQPPKTVHCSECNLCFAGYDHHCPWMGTCVGKKNFKAFVCFNVTWLVYLLYAVIFIGANLVGENNMTQHSS